MKKTGFKKLICLALAVLFVLSIAACGGSGDASGTGASDNENTSTPSSVPGQVSSGGIKQEDVSSELIEQSDLAKKDYGKKDFTFYYWYQINEITTRKINEFNSKHNANVKVTIGTSFQEDIAKSIAGGTPYDIIANHAMYFPQSIFKNLYEPLGSYIKDVDYFDSANPQNGGISKTLNESFTWNGKLYAAGSAKAVYSYAFYYNKKKFADAGLEDPYTLWKEGKWTWDKLMEQGKQVTDVANTVGYLETPELHTWLTLNGLNYIKKTGENAFSENLGDKAVIASINEYRDLVLGDEPICVMGGKQLSWYAYITYTDAYTQIANQVRTSSAFGRKIDNLGIVPVPTGRIEGGKYATHCAQGYSAAKGAKDPTVAACYALFESRVRDSDVGSAIQMPAEIRNAIDDAFAKNGFCPVLGFMDTEGTYASSVINRGVGYAIVSDGADVASTINTQRPILSSIITSTLNAGKSFKG